MAAGVWVASVPLPRHLGPLPFPASAAASFLAPALPLRRPRRRSLAVCFVLGERSPAVSSSEETVGPAAGDEMLAAARLAEKVARKRSERYTYLVAAVMSSFGITSMAVAAVYYRFYWQFEGEIPISEMFGTFALSVGAAVGMEFWARWAHRALWHASLWHMHEVD